MTKKLFAVLLSVIMVFGVLPVSVSAASEYTSCASGTVSWQMIYDNPKTYYWVDSDKEYCALTAEQSGEYYYVTLYRTAKGNEVRYLKQNKSDDSGSKHEWSDANAKYTGGVLYQKGSNSGSGGGTTGGNTGGSSSSLADGTYTATSNSSFTKDDETYKATVTVTVAGGKITALTATGATTSKNKSYFEKALSGISASLVGQTATADSGNNVDAVSKATYSSKLIKEAITIALSDAPSSGGTTGGNDTPSQTSGTDYVLVSKPTNGKKYIISNEDEKGTGYVLTGTGGTVKIKTIDSDSKYGTSYITVNDESNVLTFIGSTSSFTLKNSEGKFLSFNKNKKPANVASSGTSFAYSDKRITYGSYYFYLDDDDGYVLRDKKGEKLYFFEQKESTVTPVTYTVTWKNYDGTTLETDTNTASGTKPSYNGATPVKESDSQYVYSFAGWATSQNQTNGTAAANLPTVSGNITYYAVFSKTARSNISDGLYGDNSATVQRFNYTPVVTVTVKNGIITNITANADTNSTNLEFLEDAVIGLKSRLVNQSASAINSLDPDVDAVSGATYASKAVIADIQKAISESPKGYYTVTWQNYDGTVLKTDKNVAYGSQTSVYDSVPTRNEDSSYTYTFKNWTPDVSKFVTDNISYKAEYTATEKEIVEPEPTIADGLYGDNSATVQRFNYTPIVTVTVNNGVITDITADADTNNRNLAFLEDVITGLKSRLVNQSASAINSLDPDVDAVSGATYASKAVIVDIQKAISESPKGYYTVTWQNYDGTVLKTDKNVAYGSQTSVYDSVPTRNEDSSYTYTFKNWTPDVSKFVTENAEYTAVFDETEKKKLTNDSSIESNVVLLGKTINIQAAASGGTGEYSYCVYYKKSADTVWKLYSNWGTETEYNIKPAKATLYNVCVKVKDENGTIVKKYFDVTVNGKLANESTVETSQIVLGKTINIKTAASGGIGAYSYCVYYKKSTDTVWKLYSNWSTETEYSIKPVKATLYNVCVKVKDENGTIVKKYFDVTVNEKLANLSTVSSEINFGETFNVKALASGGMGAYQYCVYYKKSTDTVWKLYADWNTETEYNIKPVKATLYNVCVKVKDENGTVVKNYFDVTVK